jgi:hypothetical protein
MLESLKELIFGLNEFEKAKIDDRINQAFLLVPKIKLQRLEDFEILEENIYKLKEQLRIKSSNLNRVIKSSKLISKKQVLNFIKDLETIRYDFLKEVFTKYDTKQAPNTISYSNTQNNQSTPQTQQAPQPITPIESTQQQSQPQQQTKPEHIKQTPTENTNISKKQNEKEIQIIEEQNFTLLLNNGINPYLTIKFKENPDLIILKNLSSIFFEIYQMHGTNIIVENNIALIIPRFQQDNLITLPQINQDLDELFKLLKENKKPNLKLNETDIQNNTEKEEPLQLKTDTISQKVDNNNSENYLQINDTFKKQEFKTKKYDEDSLDQLLTKHQKENKPKDEPNITKPNSSKTEKIEFEKTENKIEIEHKPSEIKSQPEIEILKQDDSEDLAKESKPQNNQFQFEIYRDENIIVYFKEDSKAIGTLCITTPNGEPIHKLSENELSYLTIFSKVFAGVLFEVVGCEGTNIIWNFSENTVNIIPRHKDDKLLKMWDMNQEKPETLEKIKEKLLTTILIEQEKNKPKTPQVQNEKPKQALEEIKDETSENKEKRAKHLLDSLRRIP